MIDIAESSNVGGKQGHCRHGSLTSSWVCPIHGHNGSKMTLTQRHTFTHLNTYFKVEAYTVYVHISPSSYANILTVIHCLIPSLFCTPRL